MPNQINELRQYRRDVLPFVLRGTLGCMGGRCSVREFCPLYANVHAPHVVERACRGSWSCAHVAPSAAEKRPGGAIRTAWRPVEKD